MTPTLSYQYPCEVLAPHPEINSILNVTFLFPKGVLWYSGWPPTATYHDFYSLTVC